MHPFINLPYVPKSSNELIEIAFRRAFKVRIEGNLRGLARTRKLEERRIRSAGRYLRRRLRDICFGYPRIDKIHPFLQRAS